MDTREWPDCLKCNAGKLIPLSDYGRDGASRPFHERGECDAGALGAGIPGS